MQLVLVSQNITTWSQSPQKQYCNARADFDCNPKYEIIKTHSKQQLSEMVS